MSDLSDPDRCESNGSEKEITKCECGRVEGVRALRALRLVRKWLIRPAMFVLLMIHELEKPRNDALAQQVK